MAQTIREDASLAINEETTWGTSVGGASPIGDAIIIPVNPGEWLHENVGEERDEMVRNLLARDFNTVPTVRSAEGSIGGMVLPIETWWFLDSIMGGAEAGTIPDLKTVGDTATGMFVHEFTIGRDTHSLTIQQRDNILTAANAEIYLGMMCSSFTLRGSVGEGALEWEAEMIGKGRMFASTAKTESPSIYAADRLPIPLVGSHLSVSIGTGADGDETDARLLDFEIVFSREIELAYGAKATMIPNIRRQSVPRITFRATIEMQSAADIKKYSADINTGDAQANALSLSDDTHTDFSAAANLEPWHFRISSNRKNNTTISPAPTLAVSADKLLGTAGDNFGNGGDKNRAMIDIYLDRVSYGEAPILIDRSEQTATFEFRGVALWNDTGVAATSRVGVFRVFNMKATEYAKCD